MKIKSKLIGLCDELDEQIRALQWAKNTFVIDKMAAFLPQLRAQCGWETSSDEDKQTWLLIEQRVAVRGAFEILFDLNVAGATIGQFLSEFRANGGYLDRALASVTQPPVKRAGIVLPIEWRN